MPAATISAFLAFTFITAFTPGPNNILALNNGSRYGVRGSAPVITGICTGFFCVMVICGVAVFSLSVLSDALMGALKYAGCLYIFWLAWKVATAKAPGNGGPSIKEGFFSGFILQFVNIKIIIYGLTAFSGFVLPHYDSWLAVFSFILILSLIGGAGVVSWAFAGSALKRFFARYARVANAIMAGMLIWCAVNMLL